jgi:hypothetical protein
VSIPQEAPSVLADWLLYQKGTSSSTTFMGTVRTKYQSSILDISQTKLGQIHALVFKYMLQWKLASAHSQYSALYPLWNYSSQWSCKGNTCQRSTDNHKHLQTPLKLSEVLQSHENICKHLCTPLRVHLLFWGPMGTWIDGLLEWPCIVDHHFTLFWHHSCIETHSQYFVTWIVIYRSILCKWMP